MAKENNIVTFRITPQAAEKIDRLKAEKKIASTSEYINQLICCEVQTPCDMESRIRFIPCPEKPDKSLLATGIPLCELSLVKYSEAMKVIENSGMGYFTFTVDNDIRMTIIACNKDEASMQFIKYWVYSEEQKRYLRTGKPLPRYLYNTKAKTVIIVEYGE